MKDKYGREIEYLRISLTDRCNLKCLYCSPEDVRANSAADSTRTSICNSTCTSICTSLSAGDYYNIVRAFAQIGIKRVRLTGGEPLVREDICDIVEKISSIQGITDISLTTNGVLLSKYAYKLKKAGLGRVNISLDTLKADKFQKITGSKVDISSIFEGIESAVNANLLPIRINTVLIKGENDDEIDNFIELSQENPIDVRFIELMPVSDFGASSQDSIIYNSQIIKDRPYLEKCKFDMQGGPAEYYKIKGYRGRVGFISPLSHKFCNMCNRIRVTFDGKIRPCLGDNGETDIYDVIRENPDRLAKIIREIVYNKPRGHNFELGFIPDRKMIGIGG